MYIVEAGIEPDEGYLTKYYLVGEAEQVANFKNYIGNLALGQLELNPEQREIPGFIANLATRNVVRKEHQQLFETLYSQRETLAVHRADELIDGAAAGSLTYAQLAEELKSLQSLGENQDGTIWLTKEGYWYNFDIDILPTYDLDELEQAWGKESYAYRLAEELGLDAHTYQYQLIHPEDRFNPPKLISDIEHVTLGRMSDGDFVPVVTVFNELHTPHLASDNGA